jgi:hypothetical protein
MTSHPGSTSVPPPLPVQIEPRPIAGLSIRLTEAQRLALEQLALKHDTTLSNVARTALVAGLRALGAA